jgi:4-diphosphocytidyl-2-C-methyl-D-erythritol kinase
MLFKKCAQKYNFKWLLFINTNKPILLHLPQILFKMIVFPNAKINLGLYISAKRSDGYHNIETLMYPVPFCDALEMIPSPDGKMHFVSSGFDVCDDLYANLSYRAWLLMQRTFRLPNVHIHLHKAIPAGAGLGGGSADAAFTIKLANALFNLNQSPPQLQKLAAQIGMDCPFFIENKPVIALQRGDTFADANINLGGKYVVLVKPPFHISTKDAYSAVKPAVPDVSLAEIVRLPVHQWKEHLMNDFEPFVYERFPEAKNIVPALYSEGAEYAAMSGSGSAFYGIFNHKKNCDGLFDAWFCRTFRLPRPKEIRLKT